MSETLVNRIRHHLEETKAVILQGPPGTGKTYNARKTVESYLDEGVDNLEACRWTAISAGGGHHPHLPDADGQTQTDQLGVDVDGQDVIWELVQFHPGYAYEDFVRSIGSAPSEEDDDAETLEPSDDGGLNVNFEPRDQILIQLARVAETNPDTTVILILDEINRANLGEVLGETILGIESDKRSTEERDGWPVRLQYPAPDEWDCVDADGETLTLPENLLILGTMNTADQSTALVDYALRRRFRFIDIDPDPDVIWQHYRENETGSDNLRYSVRRLFYTIRNELDLPPEYAIGHSYFLSDDPGSNPESQIATKLIHEIQALLRSYREDGRGIPRNLDLNEFGEFPLSRSLSSNEANEVEKSVTDELDESTRSMYWVHDGYGDEVWRSPQVSYNAGIVSGGRGDPQFGRSPADDIAHIGEDCDILIRRDNDGRGRGCYAVGEVKSHSWYVGIAGGDEDDYDGYTEIDSIVDELNDNPNITEIESDSRSNSDELFVKVDWLFHLPGVEELAEHQSKIVDDDIEEKIENQSFCQNEYKYAKNSESLPSIPPYSSLSDLFGGLNNRPTGRKIDSGKRRLWAYYVMRMFQIEYRFSLYSLPPQYIGPDGRLTRFHDYIELLSIPESRNPELSESEGYENNLPSRVADELNELGPAEQTNWVYNALPNEITLSESGNEADANPMTTPRVWIPVFSDPFSIRDDEFLYDGTKLHRISRSDEKLYRNAKTETVTEQDWEYVGDEDLSTFFSKEVAELQASAPDTAVESLYRMLLFADRNDALDTLLHELESAAPIADRSQFDSDLISLNFDSDLDFGSDLDLPNCVAATLKLLSRSDKEPTAAQSHVKESWTQIKQIYDTRQADTSESEGQDSGEQHEDEDESDRTDVLGQTIEAAADCGYINQSGAAGTESDEAIELAEDDDVMKLARGEEPSDTSRDSIGFWELLILNDIDVERVQDALFSDGGAGESS